MSSPNNYTLVLSQEAQADIDDFLLYTELQRGVGQKDKYGDKLDEAFLSIQAEPRIGAPRPELPRRYRVYHVGRQYIIYLVQPQTVIVMCVLHDKMS